MPEERRGGALDANREAWNRAAEHHWAHPQYQELLEGFAKPGFSCLDETETALHRKIGLGCVKLHSSIHGSA